MKLASVILAGLLVVCSTAHTRAGFELGVDLGAGIGNDVSVSIGDTITASIYLTQSLPYSNKLLTYGFGVSNPVGTVVGVPTHTPPTTPAFVAQVNPTALNGLTFVGGDNFFDGIQGLDDGTYLLGTIQVEVTSFGQIAPIIDGGNGDHGLFDTTGAPIGGVTLTGASAVPEPSALAVLGLSAVGMVVRRRRKA